MKRLLTFIIISAAGMLAAEAYQESPQPSLHMIGDSTMASYDESSTNTRGWGQYLQSCFKGMIVHNHGKGGASSKSFYEDERLWPSVKKEIKEGDFLLIQFAHNDEKNSGMDSEALRNHYATVGIDTLRNVGDRRGTCPSTSYREYIRRYVEEARQLGAVPVLVAPICRMYFAGDSIKRSGCHDLGENFSSLAPEGVRKGCSVGPDCHLMDYPYQMRSLAELLGVPFVDMTAATRKLYLAYGDEACHAVLGDGKGSTHLSEKGARAIGELFARECLHQNLFTPFLSLPSDDAYSWTSVQPLPRLFDVVVAEDGSGDFKSIQEAVDSAPENLVVPWLIFVKNGSYQGHVDIPISKPMLHFIGQDRDKTVIFDDRLCGGENAHHVSTGATVVVNSNDCLFENLTLENSHGHRNLAGPQALALNTAGDRTIFNNVAMLSFQDTWITPSTSSYRAYVKNSLIEGAVDFIYNSGDVFVENTTLLINRKKSGYIVAPSHKDDVRWGYVFSNCTITAPGDPSETTVWFGRPWHNSPKTVFLNTRLEVNVPEEGWYETMGGLPCLWADWNTTDRDGRPVDLSKRRVSYFKKVNDEKIYGTAKNYLTDEEAAAYTVESVLSGSDGWNPLEKTVGCLDPEVYVAENGQLKWNAVPGAVCYVVTSGDRVLGFTSGSIFDIGEVKADDCGVQAVNRYGGLSPKGSPTLCEAL
ncbi:MAG: hypothetical protein K2N48_03155 [Muribaculaceae bacterium]|nr:hypothetical protein [Muribaculaceae bacterium]